MRIPVWLAWVVLLLTFFTSGLLRHFHSLTPRTPHVHPALGSLLFGIIVLLFLVAIREKKLGAMPGRGIRFGSLTPILLMLLLEKWISIGFYAPAFRLFAPGSGSDVEIDARYRAMAGAGLLLACVLFAFLSLPARRNVWSQLRPSRWLVGLGAGLFAVLGSYGLLWVLSKALGARFHLAWPGLDSVLVLVLTGQAVRAFAEEVYYRGLLQSEMGRLAPRLGARRATAKRWAALLPPSILFGMEHIPVGAPYGELLRQFAFPLSLGLLLGILVMLTKNLVFAASVHAWINWLLLGAAPALVDKSGAPAIPAGTYIGLALALTFLAAFYLQPRRAAAPS